MINPQLRIILTIYALLLCLENPLYSQPDVPLPRGTYALQQYTVKEGLSQSLTQNATQDHRGYLWIHTREGINRFDGLQFNNHRNDSRFPDDIIRLVEVIPEKDQVWVSGRRSWYLYQGDSMQIIPRLFDAEDRLIEGRFVDNEGNFFIHASGPDTELPRQAYSWKNGAWNAQICPIAPNEPFLNSLYSLPNGEGVLGIHMEDRLHSVYLYPPAGDPILLLQKEVYLSWAYPILKIRKGRVFLRLDKTVYEWKEHSFQPVLEHTTTFRGYTPRDHDIVIHNDTMLYRCVDGNCQDMGIRLPLFYNIMADVDNQIWITGNDGLYKVQSDALQVFPRDRGCLGNVWGIEVDAQNQLWISSQQRGMQTLSTDRYDYQSQDCWKQYFQSGRLTEEMYIGSHRRNNGDMLFSTSKRVLQIEPNGDCSSLEADYYPRNTAIQDIKEYDQSIYLAAHGLLIVDSTGQTTQFGQKQGYPLPELGYLESVDMDTQGRVWLGSHDGLGWYDPESKESAFRFREQDLSLGINTIYRDQEDNLWFGTHSGLRLLRKGEDWPAITLSNTVQGSVKSIVKTEDQLLVLGMLDQILVLDLKSWEGDSVAFVVFSKETGFAAVDCIQHASVIGKNGKVWIGTRTELLCLDPQAIHWESNPFPIQINAAYIVQSEGTNPLVIEEGKIQVQTTDQFQIGFFQIESKRPLAVRYQYRLRDEEAWSPTNASRVANYSNLDVGSYDFQVRACLDSRCGEAAHLQIEVVPGKWIHATWFWIALWSTGLMLMGLAFLFWWQQNSRKHQSERLQLSLEKELAKQLQLQQQLYISQTDPHFVFNSLNSMIGLISLRGKEEAMDYLRDFSNLFRQVLSTQHAFLYPLEQEIKIIEQYIRLEKLRFGSRFDYRIDLDENLQTEALVPKLLIQSFVHNAIKHGLEGKKKDGVLEVKFEQYRDHVLVIIRDNGKGILASPSEPRSEGGKGIPIAKKTVEWMQRQGHEPASLTLRKPTVFTSGTEIEIQIPLSLSKQPTL
ncbi:MAG: histidine kinase [Bacteroidota bacterium]